MAALNPILLVVAAFVLYVAVPPIGGIFMPVAMNFAHVIFFTASTLRGEVRDAVADLGVWVYWRLVVARLSTSET